MKPSIRCSARDNIVLKLTSNGNFRTPPGYPGYRPHPAWLLHHERRPGTVIYVGKAISLRNRLRSYFHASAQEDRKTRQLVRHIADIEWIVVGSELEALILEMNLIKKHRPQYNVRLKDDKRYPYIKVHWDEAFPQADRHPPDERGWLALLRPLHQRVGGAPDAGCAAAHLPLPDLRPGDHRSG